MSNSQISPDRSRGSASNGEEQYQIAGMALGDDLTVRERDPNLLVALVTQLQARVSALESQRPTPDIVTPTNPSLPGSTKASTAPQFSTTRHGHEIDLSAADFAIDNLDEDIQAEVLAGGVPNDVRFASPWAHRASCVSDVPAVDTVNPVNINDVDEINADDSMDIFFDFSAASIPDYAGMGTATNEFDLYDGIVDMEDSPAASMLHNSVIHTASGLAMTAHVSPGNSMLADYTPGTAVNPPTAARAATPSRPRHRCTTCPRSFARRADRDRHFLTRHTNGIRTYSCTFPGCHRVGSTGFWRLDKFNEHRERMGH